MASLMMEAQLAEEHCLVKPNYSFLCCFLKVVFEDWTILIVAWVHTSLHSYYIAASRTLQICYNDMLGIELSGDRLVYMHCEDVGQS